MTHLAMSSAPETMPPAGLVLSLRNGATGRTVSFTSACGVATLPGRPAAEWSTSLCVIPTRARMRVRTNCSQVCPDTVSITSPATR
jgi:hypothetical protein